MAPPPQPPKGPLERAAEALLRVLPDCGAARRWFDAVVAVLGERAVVDTAEKGRVRWVIRRERGGRDLLTSPALVWCGQGRQVGERMELLELLEVYDGQQKISFAYTQEGAHAETALNPLVPGRLVELAGLLARAQDGFRASVEFVAGLGDERFGPARLHYPVAAPGGVRGAWSVGRMGCRRALHDGKVEASARFVVADGLEGRAVGWGATKEEALAAYAAEVARELPRHRPTEEFANDDYDDEGNLLQRGSLEGMFGGVLPPPDDAPTPGNYTAATPEVDPITGEVDMTGGPMMLSGPKSDCPPVPPRPECVPHVLVALDPSPPGAPPAGRWVRLLGEWGVTRHAVRMKDGEGFLLVGADLLGLVDLRTLREELDRLDAEAAASGREHEPMFPQFVRWRSRLYAWRPAHGDTPAGLHSIGSECGPRFDAGGLDGDRAQAQIRRQHRVPRPTE